MDKIDQELLEQIADLHTIPQGSYSIRKNGKVWDRNSTSDIEILPKKDKEGIDVIVHKNVKNQSVHIPVMITQGGLNDLVYNDFYIEENADVLIVAGCGIHNVSTQTSKHQGVHIFHLGKNSRVRYVEKHLGIGNRGEKILDPVTNVFMKEGSTMHMETVQLGGVSHSVRDTKATVADHATLVVEEKILTTGKQSATTNFEVVLQGKNSHAEITSRSVAKDHSYQSFDSQMIGKEECFGHVSCDGILVGNARIDSTPKLSCQNASSTLIHEAAIGKIAGEQLTKLMTLGLSYEQAEELIIKGFLS